MYNISFPFGIKLNTYSNLLYLAGNFISLSANKYLFISVHKFKMHISNTPYTPVLIYVSSDRMFLFISALVVVYKTTLYDYVFTSYSCHCMHLKRAMRLYHGARSIRKERGEGCLLTDDIL
jgi:hypothetical protein